MKYKKIFDPIKINGLELKNRMIVPAMVTNYCTEDGLATEKFIAYQEKKAQGGWGAYHNGRLCCQSYGRRF